VRKQKKKGQYKETQKISKRGNKGSGRLCKKGGGTLRGGAEGQKKKGNVSTEFVISKKRVKAGAKPRKAFKKTEGQPTKKVLEKGNGRRKRRQKEKAATHPERVGGNGGLDRGGKGNEPGEKTRSSQQRGRTEGGVQRAKWLKKE